MHQTKLIQLLKCFSPKEIKQFDSFLQSPYFNKNELPLRFYRLLSPHYPAMKSAKLDKEKVYAKLYGPVAYKDKTMRDLTSELYKLAKTFIVHEEIDITPLEASAIRQKWMFKRAPEKLKNEELETRRVLLEKITQHDAYYYKHLAQYDHDKFELTADQLRSTQYKILQGVDLLAPIHSLNRSYLMQSFVLNHYLLAISGIYNFTYDRSALTHIDVLAASYVGKGDPVIDLYYNILWLAKTHDQKYFFALKELIFKNDKRIPRHRIAEGCIALENYAERKIREGEEQFVTEVMPVFRFELENDLYLEDGKMSTTYYHNVVIRGLEAKETDWVDNFVESYKDKLWQESKEDFYNYARAHVLFARKKYREALRIALSLNLDLLTRILARGFICRAQYELGMLDELMVTLGSFTYLLKDERFTAERKQHFQLFISMIRQLAELKGNYKHQGMLRLLNLAETQKGAMSRKWFLEKITELRNTKSDRSYPSETAMG